MSYDSTFLVLNALCGATDRYPDQRAGQLIYNLIRDYDKFNPARSLGDYLFNITDEEFARVLERRPW